MTSPAPKYTAYIHAATPHSVEQKLAHAVDSVQNHAREEGRHGVKVTRHSLTTFTVAVSPDVAYGWTTEHDELRNS